jgi:hypothetical protein
LPVYRKRNVGITKNEGMTGRRERKIEQRERGRSAEENLEVISCRYIDIFITVIILSVTFGTERENA